MSNSTTSCPYLKQALHNERFHSNTCEHFPDDYYDWKITTLFYVAIHYVKALANQNGIDIGTDHFSIRNNIKPPTAHNAKPAMAFNKNAYGLYDYMYRTSQTSRYNGFSDKSGIFTDEATFKAIMQHEHEVCQEAITKLKKYIIDNRGLKRL